MARRLAGWLAGYAVIHINDFNWKKNSSMFIFFRHFFSPSANGRISTLDLGNMSRLFDHCATGVDPTLFYFDIIFSRTETVIDIEMWTYRYRDRRCLIIPQLCFSSRHQPINNYESSANWDRSY